MRESRVARHELCFLGKSLFLLVLCVAGAHAQQPAAPADAKSAATATLRAAEGQVDKDRAQLRQDYRVLEEARKSGDRDRIDRANSAVRKSRGQLADSRSKRDTAKNQLAALEKPEKDAAKARGEQMRAERAKRHAALSKERAERRAATEKAQAEHKKQQGVLDAEKERRTAERREAQKHGDELRAEREEQRKLRQAEKEEERKLREPNKTSPVQAAKPAP
ncbi:MAG TPA: hypothetical protein VKF40_26715 [Burkholderiales bacterium]|nr:hypothetical protein [Burkholderiales bacterium]